MKTTEEIFKELDKSRLTMQKVIRDENVPVVLYGTGYTDALEWVLGVDVDDAEWDKLLWRD